MPASWEHALFLCGLLLARRTQTLEQTPHMGVAPVSPGNMLSSVLAHEAFVKVGQASNDLLDRVFRRKDRRPDVESALLLAKARARNSADAGCFKQCKAVERVCRLSGFLGSFHGLQHGPPWSSV